MRQRVVVAAGVLGLAVLTLSLVLVSLASVHTTRIDSFQRTGDPRKLVLNLALGLGDEIAERTVREDDRSVTITVRIRRTYETAPSLGVFVPIVATLRDPLGERAVRDADGSVVRELDEIYRPPGTTPRR